jgi:hypothetical protein
MTIVEILEQVRALSPAERKELLKRLIDMFDVPVEKQPPKAGAEIVAMLEANTEAHWGKSLNQLLDEIGPIEMKYPEIEDPVEWVKHLRAEERRRRLGDLDNAT